MAHNVPFDRGILGSEMLRAGLPSPASAMYCTLRLARRVFPDAPDHKLGTLAGYLKLDREPSHRALADALTTLALFRACLAGASRGLLALHGPPGRL